ncbi:MAG: hypothetical protein ABIA47_01650 [bacterium]
MNRYVQHRSDWTSDRPRSTEKGRKRWFWIFGAVVVVLAVIVVFGRGDGDDDYNDDHDSEATPEIMDVEIVETVEDVEIEEKTLPIIEIELRSVPAEAGYSGMARRGTSGTLFTHVVVANVPQIDLGTHYYEGWLVKPGVLKFFSTGEMFARDDGLYGLVWEVEVGQAQDDLFDFTEVVITREIRDGNEAPSITHVLEGRF